MKIIKVNLILCLIIIVACNSGKELQITAGDNTSSDVKNSEESHNTPGMSCLINENGLRRKVLISKRDVLGYHRINEYNELEDDSPRNMEFYHIYYLVDTYPKPIGKDISKAKYYKISRTPNTNSEKLWIKRSNATLWDHRVVYRPEGSFDRKPPLLVYRSSSAIEEIIKNGRTDQEPIARFDLYGDADKKWMPWPIIETKWVDGHEISKIAFIAKEGKYKPITYSKDDINEVYKNFEKLDVVFVVDNTLSTTPFIDAIKSTVNMIINKLSEYEGIDLQFGLVLYRDYIPGLMFTNNGKKEVTKTIGLTGDIRKFKEIIQPLKAAEISSKGWPEAVFDGLWESLTSISWRGNSLSAHAIILIGDNSGHTENSGDLNPNKISMNKIIQKSIDNNTHILSLCIDGGGGETEQSIHRSQFKKLAEDTDGASYTLNTKNVEMIIEHILKIINNEKREIYKKTDVVKAVEHGDTDVEIMKNVNISIEELTEVFTLLSTAGIDVEELRASGSAYCEGWILPQFHGYSIVNKEIYISRDELRFLIRFLQDISLELGPNFGQKLHNSVVSFVCDGKVDVEYDVLLKAIGIPVQTGLLSFSEQELRHMNEITRLNIRSAIEKKHIPQLMNVLNDDSIFPFGGELEFGFVDVDYLP